MSIFSFYGSILHAQGYQGLHGSPYTGSTAMYNNPAASIGSAYKWDLTLFSAQVKASTQSFFLKNFTLANNNTAYLTLKDDYSSKFVHATVDASLFNFSYKIDNNKAFSFGIRARTYNHSKTLPFNYIDSSVNNFHSFLVANRNTYQLEGFVTHTGWLESDLNYAQVLAETNTSKLTGGITLQIMKGLSGAFAKVNKFSYQEEKNATDTAYTFTNGTGAFAYSDNYDQSNFNDYYKKAKTSLGLSLGIEYLIYQPDFNKESNHNLNYDWKIGLSIMDIGSNSFIPTTNASKFSTPDPSLTDITLENKLVGAANFIDFSDSLNSIFLNSSSISENYTVSTPTRMVVNIDKNLGNHFFINGELSMNFFSSSGYDYKKLKSRELNLLTITPRWETIGWGAYFPLQYNTQGQLWVGAAVKLGPLVMGVHSLGIFKKDPTINGGAYLMLSLHPFNKRKVLSTLDCTE